MPPRRLCWGDRLAPIRTWSHEGKAPPCDPSVISVARYPPRRKTSTPQPRFVHRKSKAQVPIRGLIALRCNDLRRNLEALLTSIFFARCEGPNSATQHDSQPGVGESRQQCLHGHVQSWHHQVGRQLVQRAQDETNAPAVVGAAPATRGSGAPRRPTRAHRGPTAAPPSAAPQRVLQRAPAPGSAAKQHRMASWFPPDTPHSSRGATRIPPRARSQPRCDRPLKRRPRAHLCRPGFAGPSRTSSKTGPRLPPNAKNFMLAGGSILRAAPGARHLAWCSALVSVLKSHAAAVRAPEAKMSPLALRWVISRRSASPKKKTVCSPGTSPPRMAE